jgi:peptide/nickel transport system permease protein
VVGTVLGIIVVWRRGSLMDSILSPFFTFLSAIPYFWLALVLLYILGAQLNWFPIHGGYDSDTTEPGWSLDFILSAAQYAILPAVTIILGSLAGWMLGMRNAMVTTLSEDYVLMAEAKGLSPWRVMFTYAGRNAILPNITTFALSLGFVVSGSLLTEIVFSYPGIGYATLQAIDNLDYALLQGIFLFITIAVLGANFLSDLVYVLLDPRVRTGRS